MKHLKKFNIGLKNIKDAKVRDYVICDLIIDHNNINYIISNDIGRITNKHGFTSFIVEYKNPLLKNNINDGCCIIVNSNEILYCSTNKEELEVILKSRKYNI